MYTPHQQREIFHLLFLERLLKVSDPRAFVLKGGANLRFFFGSPRYSEDLDVLASVVGTLRKNGYRIPQTPPLRQPAGGGHGGSGSGGTAGVARWAGAPRPHPQRHREALGGIGGQLVMCGSNDGLV